MADVNMYSSFIMSQVAYKTTYHNHKENMAWVATAFYVPAIIILGSRASDICQFYGWKWVATVILLLAACLIFKFVHTQFCLRWDAADVVEGLRRAHAELCTITEMRSKDWEEIRCSTQWPQFIQQKINQRTNQEPRECGKALREWLCCGKKVDDRWQTEFPSYSAIILATVMAVVLVWFN